MKYKECIVYYQLKVYIVKDLTYFKTGLQWIYFKHKEKIILISNNTINGFYIEIINTERFNYITNHNKFIKIYFESPFLELINATQQNQDKLNQTLIWEILQQKIKEATNEK